MGYQKGIAEILAKLTLFVLPSIREPLGICLLEAMATGLPVVATNVGGIPEVVKDKETGLLVSPKDPKALAHAILTLLQNGEKAKNMGIAGRKRVEEKFNITTMVRKTEDIYQDLIEKKFLKG
ncbi:Alpha-maltose-1-phosphate synthase [subsurface metagenome]